MSDPKVIYLFRAPPDPLDHGTIGAARILDEIAAQDERDRLARLRVQMARMADLRDGGLLDPDAEFGDGGRTTPSVTAVIFLILTAAAFMISAAAIAALDWIFL